MTVAPIGIGDVVTSWTFNAPAVVVLVTAALVYLLGVYRAHCDGARWPWWRTATFLVLGLGGTAWVICGVLGVYNHTLFWALALQITLLVSIVPVSLTLGDPAGLARAGRKHRPRRPIGVFVWVMRVFSYPLVGPVVVMVSQMVLLFSGYLHAALTHSWVMDLLYLNMLAAGCLVTVPLLGVDEILPSWCTDGMKVVVATLDGTLDAIPGICTFTTSTPMGRGYYQALHLTWTPQPLHDTHIGGGLMITVAEVLGIPMIFMLFFRWARKDIREAAEHDARIEAVPDVSEDAATLAADRPWWETDPRFRNPRA